MGNNHNTKKLGALLSTAISGNDLLSSVLYISGIVMLFAGIYTPIIFVLITIALLIYKAIYIEVVEALPVNGGSYNTMLNATSKSFAAITGVITLLSYLATGVLSAKVAIDYLATVVSVPVIPAAILLLLLIGVLVILGVKESANLALGMFTIHFFALVVFLVIAAIYLLTNDHIYALNLVKSNQLIASNGGILNSVYLAFAAGLLGASGFETSANFVEEQAKGVFRKTLRNMIAMFAFFNPVISMLVLGFIPLEKIIENKDYLLAYAAEIVGGNLFGYFIAVDAFIVMAATVLTAYIGVSGLIQRMTADGCFPEFINKQNSKGSFPRITLLFFLVCSSILIATKGNILSLAGVYSIAFIGVMATFAFSNLMLKESRTELKRTYSAPLIYVIIGLAVAFIGIIGNIRIDPRNLVFFEVYFIPVAIVVLFMIYQDYFMKFLLRSTKGWPRIHNYIQRNFKDMINGEFVVFVRNVDRLHDVLDYVNRNEIGWNLKLVHCGRYANPEKDKDFREIREALPHLRKAGVYAHFKITLLYKQAKFGPEVITDVAKELGVHQNRILIGSIKHHHSFDYSDLGGVRIIF